MHWEVVIIKYLVKETIYYGEESEYSPALLADMQMDGFKLVDGDVLIPVGTVMDNIPDGIFDEDTYQIGYGVYDVCITDDYKSLMLDPFYD